MRLAGLAMVLASSAALAAEKDVRQDRFSMVGEIRTRTALEQRHAGNIGIFSIGMETFERNYASYEPVAPYVGPLGAAHARLMSGWAYIETRQGDYNFAQLDRIVDDLNAKGVRPWITLNYGNPAVYGPDAGGADLGGRLPKPGPTREAWLRFVDRTVRHFRAGNRVVEWEIWNEPDPQPEYAAFAVETGKAILKANPKAIINLGAFTSYTQHGPGTPGFDYARQVIDTFARDAGVPPRQVKVSYHPYLPNPDGSYGPAFQAFRALAERHGYRVRQGENGAPSVFQQNFALKNLPWTEDGQAKYALRRMISDLAHGVETGIFTLMETHYPPGSGWLEPKGFWTKNSKGLLQTGYYTGRLPGATAYGDHSVLRAKAGYRAVQSLTAVFDRRVTVEQKPDCRAPLGYVVYAFRREDPRGPVRGVAVWRATDRPGAEPREVPVTITCRALPLGTPDATGNLSAIRLTNFLTGTVYQVRPEAKLARRDGEGFTMIELPVGDTPVLLHDAAFVPVGGRES